MNRTWLHLGAHKTATSFIQHTLRESGEFFADQRSIYVGKTDLGSADDLSEMRKFQRSPSTEVPEGLRRIIGSVRRYSSDEDRTSALISYEGLLGGMMLADTRTLYPSHERMLTLLAEELEDHEAKVAFAIRSYESFIPSTYSWWVAKANWGLPISFDEYVERIDLPGLSWVPIVRSLRAHFGDANVHVWTYESFRRDSVAGLHRMLRFFYGDEIDLAQVSIDTTRRNVSVSARRARALRRANQQMAHRHVRGKSNLLLAWSRVAIKRSALFRGPPTAIHDPVLSGRLRERYERECAELGIAE